MFLLKKIIAPFFYPVPLIFLILIGGLYTLWFTSRQKAGKILVSVGTAIFILMSYGISDIALKSLEYQYPLYTENAHNNIAFVVVLSGGNCSDPNIPITSQISAASLTRLIEGIRIHRQIPDSKLVLSGGGAFDPVPEAETMAKVAESLGINRSRIIIESESNDTADQAKTVKRIVGNSRFVLVTSALHMPRSMALFKKQGMNPIPAPTEHRIAEGQKWSPGMFFPSAGNLDKAGRTIHEYMGMIWSKMRGDL